MRAAEPCGVVTIPLLDLRRRPDHASEMCSQLLLGEGVDVLARADAGRWLRVRNHADGYRGWVRSWGLVLASRPRARAWVRLARHRVNVLGTELRTAPGGGGTVSPLVWNSRVIAGPRRGRHTAVELPDGRRGWVVSASLAAARLGPPRLVQRIRSLIGAPYLWGGRSPAGLDCSGF